LRAIQRLRAAGQSLCLDELSRSLVRSGTLERYIRDFCVTGVTSNPSILRHAIADGHEYDDAIRRRTADGEPAEDLLFSLALEDLTHSADLLRPAHDSSHGADGWVSVEVSPALALDPAATLAAAKALFARAARPNLFIKIPGTRAGLAATEQAVVAGIPVNVTLLFSREQYLAAAEAHLRGLERRLAAGLQPDVRSVASVFVSRWDAAVNDAVAAPLHNRLGIATAMRTYKAHRDLLASDRWRRLLLAGARSQRLVWASTGTKDPMASNLLYVGALAAAHTIDTMPEKVLLALAQHEQIEAPLPRDGGEAEAVIGQFVDAGIDVDALAARLQQEGISAFGRSWSELLVTVRERGQALEQGTDHA